MDRGRSARAAAAARGRLERRRDEWGRTERCAASVEWGVTGVALRAPPSDEGRPCGAESRSPANPCPPRMATRLRGPVSPRSGRCSSPSTNLGLQPASRRPHASAAGQHAARPQARGGLHRDGCGGGRAAAGLCWRAAGDFVRARRHHRSGGDVGRAGRRDGRRERALPAGLPGALPHADAGQPVCGAQLCDGQHAGGRRGQHPEAVHRLGCKRGARLGALVHAQPGGHPQLPAR